MISRLRFALLCIVLSTASPCEAAGIIYFPLVYGSGDLPGRAVIDSTGAAVSSGYVGAGVFSVSDAQVDQWIIGGNLQALIASFSPVIGTDDFQYGLPNHFAPQAVPGLFGIVGSVDPVAAGLVGASLYTFIGNGASLSQSTEIGLFLHDVTLNADPPSSPQSYLLDLSEGSVKIGVPTDADINLEALGFGVMRVGVLQLIPEPSSVFMACLGAGLLFWRRR